MFLIRNLPLLGRDGEEPPLSFAPPLYGEDVGCPLAASPSCALARVCAFSWDMENSEKISANEAVADDGDNLSDKPSVDRSSGGRKEGGGSAKKEETCGTRKEGGGAAKGIEKELP